MILETIALMIATWERAQTLIAIGAMSISVSIVVIASVADWMGLT